MLNGYDQYPPYNLDGFPTFPASMRHLLLQLLRVNGSCLQLLRPEIRPLGFRQWNRIFVLKGWDKMGRIMGFHGG